MKGKDSYPPASLKNNDANSSSNRNDSELSSESKSDGEEIRKRSDNYHVEDSIDSENDISDDEYVQESWDGSEAEIVIDDESEEYEEETTGIKIKYVLKPDEICEFVQSSERYENNKKAQKKHTFIQSIVFVFMVVLGMITGNQYYLILSALPVISLALIWIVPYVGIRKLVEKAFKNQEFSVEVFPDKIDVVTSKLKKEIMLDGSCESDESENMIQIFSKGEPILIIPIRAVEPEFLADLQAMVLAGTCPRYKN